MKDRFQELLKKIRTDLNLSQEEFSDGLGIHHSQYNGYESGRSTPRIETLFRMLENIEIDKTGFFNLLCSEELLEIISRKELMMRLKVSL